jgi:7,8-dihydroneopterin aldolase/epimerase/oxygenase
MLTKGKQTLSLTGLRFNANLGILAHEKSAPQAIEVDVHLNMGSQPLQPNDDDIAHVLDYRKVHTLVIQTCTEQHINLLESITGKLCTALMHMPNVLGARVKIVKLEIFDDCEVAIQQEAGQW